MRPPSARARRWSSLARRMRASSSSSRPCRRDGLAAEARAEQLAQQTAAAVDAARGGGPADRVAHARSRGGPPAGDRRAAGAQVGRAGAARARGAGHARAGTAGGARTRARRRAQRALGGARGDARRVRRGARARQLRADGAEPPRTRARPPTSTRWPTSATPPRPRSRRWSASATSRSPRSSGSWAPCETPTPRPSDLAAEDAEFERKVEASMSRAFDEVDRLTVRESTLAADLADAQESLRDATEQIADYERSRKELEERHDAAVGRRQQGRAQRALAGVRAQGAREPDAQARRVQQRGGAAGRRSAPRGVAGRHAGGEGGPGSGQHGDRGAQRTARAGGAGARGQARGRGRAARAARGAPPRRRGATPCHAHPPAPAAGGRDARSLRAPHGGARRAPRGGRRDRAQGRRPARGRPAGRGRQTGAAAFAAASARAPSRQAGAASAATSATSATPAAAAPPGARPQRRHRHRHRDSTPTATSPTVAPPRPRELRQTHAPDDPRRRRSRNGSARCRRARRRAACRPSSCSRSS